MAKADAAQLMTALISTRFWSEVRSNVFTCFLQVCIGAPLLNVMDDACNSGGMMRI